MDVGIGIVCDWSAGFFSFGAHGVCCFSSSDCDKGNARFTDRPHVWGNPEHHDSTDRNTLALVVVVIPSLMLAMFAIGPQHISLLHKSHLARCLLYVHCSFILLAVK